MKKDLYKIIKNELQQRRNNTKYFNYAFFEKYIKAIQAYNNNLKAGVDDSYKDGIVTKYHHYDDIYNDKFYMYNGGCYCEFLAVANDYYNRLLTT